MSPDEKRRAAKKKLQTLKRKRAAIDAVEKATELKEKNKTPTGQSWTEGFLFKLLAKVLNNAQMHVQHLHLRMEDPFSDPIHPYAVGMTLEAIIIKSADEGWNYTMVGRGNNHQVSGRGLELYNGRKRHDSTNWCLVHSKEDGY
ncbi:hypothetical protein PsorP6_015606 [Peronosclerospora sorghi]|uniref:Uncharacterized protein n=1 Tax=Peronosclerospora sorghi TaxID=230839 RepID=A0ACC0WLV0_9STRA|nr:hypothetical protein PsorP6_015606 [Peronosclerospora sorghi]